MSPFWSLSSWKDLPELYLCLYGIRECRVPSLPEWGPRVGLQRRVSIFNWIKGTNTCHLFLHTFVWLKNGQRQTITLLPSEGWERRLLLLETEFSLNLEDSGLSLSCLLTVWLQTSLCPSLRFSFHLCKTRGLTNWSLRSLPSQMDGCVGIRKSYQSTRVFHPPRCLLYSYQFQFFK